MNGPVHQLKAHWRKTLQQRLRSLTPSAMRADSTQICQRLLNLAEWQKAALPLLFHPLPFEPDVRPVLQDRLARGRSIALPAYLPDMQQYAARLMPGYAPLSGLVPGPFAVPEPPPTAPIVPWNQLDFILVPGLGFSTDGWRLGRGRGYYDRILALASGVRCGVAFDEQVVDELPAEAHDMRLDVILSPSRGCWCTPPLM